MSQVADRTGKLIEVDDLIVESTRIYHFVDEHRKDYFEDHGLEWCLDEIITRGIAEITRQIKTAEKQAQNRAAGQLVEGMNLTLDQARELIVAALKAKASATNGTTVPNATPATK